MITLHRTLANDQDFLTLVSLLDEELAERDGEDHSFYKQFNSIGHLGFVVVLKENDQPIGCGVIKELDHNAMEVKRMFILQGFRGKRLASLVLSELEKWALELGYRFCRLETGKRQPEAIALYERNGYQRIPNYGQYAGVENSVCFEKQLS